MQKTPEETAPVRPELAPHIFRQRLLLEGHYSVDLDAAGVGRALLGLAGALGLSPYGEPVVYSPQGKGREVNQGFDSFLPLIDSGIAGYFWTNERFFSMLVYSCAPFDPGAAEGYLRGRLGARGPVVSREF